MNTMIWKRVITSRFPLSMPMPALVFAFTVNSHITFSNFCTQIVTPSTTPLHSGVATDFLINQCCLTPEEIAKSYRHYSEFLRAKSSKNMEEILELLNGCGLTTPSEIRRVAFSYPTLFSLSKGNIKSKLTLLRTFMKEEAICKLLISNARLLGHSEARLKSALSLFQRLGVEGHELSRLLMRVPRLLTTSEEKVLETFKQVENLGIKKESMAFAGAIRGILGVGKIDIDKRVHCLCSLGFSEKQVSEVSRRFPEVLGCSEQNIKSHVDFLIKSVGFTLADIFRNPSLFGYSLEKRLIPRYRIIEALNSMQVSKTEVIGPKTFTVTEKSFLERYVNNNAQSLVLLDIYHSVKDGKLGVDRKK